MAQKKQGVEPRLGRVVQVTVPVLPGGSEAQLRRSLNKALRLVPTKLLEKAEAFIVRPVWKGGSKPEDYQK